MKCPICEGKLSTSDTRYGDGFIRRMRSCTECDFKTPTREYPTEYIKHLLKIKERYELILDCAIENEQISSEKM